jgi:hypothetical protein
MAFSMNRFRREVTLAKPHNEIRPHDFDTEMMPLPVEFLSRGPIRENVHLPELL